MRTDARNGARKDALIVQDQTVQTFMDHVGQLLYQDEAANSLILGLCHALATSARKTSVPPLFWRAVHDGKTLTAAMRTPPHNLILSAAQERELTNLANFLHQNGAELPGVIGPPQEVTTFAKSWSALTGAGISQTIEQCLYRLDSVTFPPPAKGKMLKATPAEAPLLAGWLRDFASEVLPSELRSPEESLAVVKSKIEDGSAYVWKVGDEPVAMAFVTRPTKNGISIGPVFTPMNQRGQGYASALVSQLSHAMLQSGRKFCVLYTDLANPTSNKIYIRMGYRPIAESRHLVFG